jgi:hypothetical protein
MGKKEFLLIQAEQYGLKIDPERAEMLTRPGGPWDMIQIIRAILFRVDVAGHCPLDKPDFGLAEVYPWPK